MEVLATGRGRVQGVVNFYFPSSCYFQTQHIPEKPPLHSFLFQEFNSREAQVWWMTPCPDQEILIKFARRVSQEVFFVNQASNQDYIFIWMQKLNGFQGLSRPLEEDPQQQAARMGSCIQVTTS